jgi:hypothetical protein
MIVFQKNILISWASFACMYSLSPFHNFFKQILAKWREARGLLVFEVLKSKISEKFQKN